MGLLDLESLDSMRARLERFQQILEILDSEAAADVQQFVAQRSRRTHNAPPYNPNDPPPAQKPPPRGPRDRGPFHSRDGWQSAPNPQLRGLPPPASPAEDPYRARRRLLTTITELRKIAIHFHNCAALCAHVAALLEHAIQ